MRLWPCKIDLSLLVILYYSSFQGDTSVTVVVLIVLYLGVEFLNLLAPYMFLYFEFSLGN